MRSCGARKWTQRAGTNKFPRCPHRFQHALEKAVAGAPIIMKILCREYCWRLSPRTSYSQQQAKKHNDPGVFVDVNNWSICYDIVRQPMGPLCHPLSAHRSRRSSASHALHLSLSISMFGV